MTDETYLTSKGAASLRAELEELKGPKRVDLARRLRIAIQQGDLSENADYIIAKEEQGFLEGRILELEAILKNVKIIDDKNGRRDVVDIGARVTIQEDNYSPETYYLVGVNEANPREGRISHASPIGLAIIGHREGDVVYAETPGGKLKIKILQIN
jgi:transcription elongation factor GreA